MLGKRSDHFPLIPVKGIKFYTEALGSTPHDLTGQIHMAGIPRQRKTKLDSPADRKIFVRLDKNPESADIKDKSFKRTPVEAILETHQAVSSEIGSFLDHQIAPDPPWQPGLQVLKQLELHLLGHSVDQIQDLITGTNFVRLLGYVGQGFDILGSKPSGIKGCDLLGRKSHPYYDIRFFFSTVGKGFAGIR